MVNEKELKTMIENIIHEMIGNKSNAAESN